ncbi:Pescadillo N-terminus-domain-containing protein [Kalaharituber pfeilii]|nr:Pescadillo N-terminus-domain-containing protein [Kalaharituber pfeilii]
MAKIKKKGTSGAAKAYLTRTQAVKKLQISLANFRRLCIFKGIYPREPRNRKKVSKSATHSTVFYYARDIQYLLHEPVLQKFRDHKIFARKLKRAIGRGNYTDAKRIKELHAPKITLDHIIKERYPTFTDALRDLDDALSMLHLFANLPSIKGIPPATIAECERLCNEWQHYIIRTQSLRKSFLSIKGIYYQAEINGQDILWLVPYKFAQNAPLDVDYRIMRTFVDFYQVLLGFVMFRLYTMEGLVYPPKFDAEADAKGAGLRAFSLESKGVKLISNGENGSTETLEGKDVSKQLRTLGDKIAAITTGEKEENKDAVERSGEDDSNAAALAATESFDTFQPIPSAIGTADILPQPAQITTTLENGVTTNISTLFAPFTFFLSRETPRQSLEFILRSFGCKRIGWDAVLGDGAFTENEKDPSITHQVVDRPPQAAGPGGEVILVKGGRVPGRIYVQPQYIWDCINAGKLLRPDPYAPGEVLPPHLSPWVKHGEGEYDPTAPLPEEEAESEEEEGEGQKAEDDEAGESANTKELESEAESDDEGEDDDDHGMTIDTAQSSDEEETETDSEASDAAESETQTTTTNIKSIVAKPSNTIVESDESDLSDSEIASRQHQAELEAEALGLPLSTTANKRSKKNATAAAKSKREREEAEEKEMRKIMMPRKKRKLYEKMVYSNKKREGEIKELQQKRRKIEKEEKKKGRRELHC